MKCYKATEQLVYIEVGKEKLERGVCKGCFYEINKVRGFLHTQGIVLTKDSSYSPQTPIESETSTEKPPKKKS